MPTAEYNNYDESTASRVVRWRRDSRYAVMAIWDPPASFTGPRPVYVFEPGGARQARRDLSMGAAETNGIGSGEWTVPGLMTNIFGAYVVCVSTPPGGLDFEAAEECDQEYSPECRASAALAIMFLRANCANPDVVGTAVAGRTISPEVRHWCGGGVSAGSWNQLGAQMYPVGSFSEMADGEAARGGGYKYDSDHRVGHFLGNIGQNRVSSFHEYVIDPALVGTGTYLMNGAAAIGAASLTVDGDTVPIKRGTRLILRIPTTYTVSTDAPIGNSSLPIEGDTTAVPVNCRVEVTGTYEDPGDPMTPIEATFTATVTSEYSGGSGNIDTRVWGALPDNEDGVEALEGEPITLLFQVVVTDDYAGGPGSIDIWPPLPIAIPDNAEIEINDITSFSTYGEFAWVGGYFGTASMQRVWRTDDASGRGVPMAEKIDGNVDRMVRADNPRVFELNLMLSGGPGQSMHRVDSLTTYDSFWERRNVDPSVVLPEYIDLHDAADAAHLAHQMWLLRDAAQVNTDGIQAYLSDRTKNITGTGVVPANQPWLRGRFAAYAYTVVHAFLTDPNRYGGAFSSEPLV